MQGELLHGVLPGAAEGGGAEGVRPPAAAQAAEAAEAVGPRLTLVITFWGPTAGSGEGGVTGGGAHGAGAASTTVEATPLPGGFPRPRMRAPAAPVPMAGAAAGSLHASGEGPVAASAGAGAAGSGAPPAAATWPALFAATAAELQELGGERCEATPPAWLAPNCMPAWQELAPEGGPALGDAVAPGGSAAPEPAAHHAGLPTMRFFLARADEIRRLYVPAPGL
jgi:hypothetical protein